MTLQSSFGCLRTAANFLQTIDRTYSRRLSYGDGQAFAKMLMSTFVGKLKIFAFCGAPVCRELWPSTTIRACKQVNTMALTIRSLIVATQFGRHCLVSSSVETTRP